MIVGFSRTFISNTEFSDNVSKSNFNVEKKGFYNTSLLNLKSSIYYDSSVIKATIPLEINITEKGNIHNIFVGDKGILYKKSEYNDTGKNIFNDSNIEENTKFTTSISTNNKIYSDISCHLWKNTKNMIIIFCKLNENFGEEHIRFDMQKANFIYDKYNIKIVPIYYFAAFEFKEPLLFLYSKSQTINIEEGKDTYYLKFNIGLYHNERLIIQSDIPRYIYILLDKCSIEKKRVSM